MLDGVVVGSAAESGSEPGPISEEEFSRLVQVIVDDFQPRVFALVEEHGDRIDGELFAWGLEFEGRAAVFAPEGELYAKCDSATKAHHLFSRIRKIRLVWPTFQPRQ